MEFKYWLVLTFLGAIWGSAFIFIKIAAPEFGAIGLVQMRLIIASLVLKPASNKALALLAPTPGREVSVSIFFFEVIVLAFVFVFAFVFAVQPTYLYASPFDY